MRKLCLSFIVIMILGVAVSNTALSHYHDFDEENVNKVELTEAQQQEIAVLAKSIMEQKKELMNKYAEFGVISKEKAEKINAKFDKHYKKLEENGFVPNWDKCKAKKHCEKKSEE